MPPLTLAHTAMLGALALIASGCPGSTSNPPGCPRVPGCEDSLSICCDSTNRCSEQTCQGRTYTCTGASGVFTWQAGRDVDECRSSIDAAVAREGGAQPDSGGTTSDGPAVLDGRASDSKQCACQAGTTRPCGPCNKGTQACKSDCSGYESKCNVPNNVCTPNATQGCSRCGTQTCTSSCSWGSCGSQGACNPGDKQGCPNNCGERTCSGSCSWGNCSKSGQYSGSSGTTCYSSNHCGPGVGRCVECWLVCNDDGSTRRDGWCASCSSCGAANPQC